MMFLYLGNNTSLQSYKSFQKDISRSAARSDRNAGSVSWIRKKATLYGKTTVSHKYKLVFHYLMYPGTCRKSLRASNQPIRKNISQNTNLLFYGSVTKLRSGTEEDKEKPQSFPRFEIFHNASHIYYPLQIYNIKAYELTHNLPIYL